MENARVIIPLKHGPLEISGSEDFIRQQLDRFEALIIGVEGPSSPGAKPGEAVNTKPLSGKKLDLVLHLDPAEKTVKVLSTMPARTTKERVAQMVVLYLYGLQQLGDSDGAAISALREECRRHGLFDTNFAAHLKALKQHTVLKNDKYTLTVPGRTEAERLIQELTKDEE